MKNDEFIRKVTDRSSTSKKTVEAVKDAIFKEIADCMARGEKINIRGFGTFEGRLINTKTVRNPKTGKTMEVKAHLSPKFTAGAALKEHVW